MPLDPVQSSEKLVAPQPFPDHVTTTSDLDSSQKPESTYEPSDATKDAAARRSERASRLRTWNPGGDPEPATPTVSQATRRTVTLSADVGTTLDHVLTHLVTAFEIASRLASGDQVPADAPEARPTVRSKPEYARAQGRPPLLREGEVLSPDGGGSSGFKSLIELSRILHCSYPALSTKFHSEAAEQGIDPESHFGFEFVHKGHRVRMFPSYSPKA
jgi:hypothetical protein